MIALRNTYIQPRTQPTLEDPSTAAPAPLPIDQGIYAPPPKPLPIATSPAPAPVAAPAPAPAPAPTSPTLPQADTPYTPAIGGETTKTADRTPKTTDTFNTLLPPKPAPTEPTATGAGAPITEAPAPAPAPQSPLAPPHTANVDPVVNTLPPSNPAAPTPAPAPEPPPIQINEGTPPPVNTLPASTPAAPPPASTPPASQPPATTPPPAATPGAGQNTADAAAAEERMRRILALNEETKAVQVPTTTISPDANLIDQQISPADSARLQQRQGLSDAQLARIATLDRNEAAASHAGEAIDPAVGERLAKLRAMQDSTLDKAVNGPDRYKMALDQFTQFGKDTQPEYDLTRRKALNDAAAYGYTGSGRLVTDYGNIDLARERDLDSQQSRLLNTALEGSIGDRNNLLNTLRSFGQDEAGYESQNRDELRNERAYRVGQGDKDVAAEYAKGDYLSGAEASQRAVEEAQRGEQRGERNYQRDLAEQALADQMSGARLQDELNQSEFERDQARLNSGYAQDPANAYENAAQQAFEQGQISQEQLAAILQFIAQQRNSGTQGG